MLEELKKILVEKGVSPSFHRLKIYEYLVNNRTHPTAEKIYSEIIENIPTLSRTTVYNSLRILSQKGIISSISIEDNEMRYDADISLHGHFKCLQCGELYDVNIDHLNLNKEIGLDREIDDHIISESHIYIRGTCKRCKK